MTVATIKYGKPHGRVQLSVATTGKNIKSEYTFEGTIAEKYAQEFNKVFSKINAELKLIAHAQEESK